MQGQTASHEVQILTMEVLQRDTYMPQSQQHKHIHIHQRIQLRNYLVMKCIYHQSHIPLGFYNQVMYHDIFTGLPHTHTHTHTEIDQKDLKVNKFCPYGGESMYNIQFPFWLVVTFLCDLEMCLFAFIQMCVCMQLY